MRWLASNIDALDTVLGIGLTSPQREVGAGDFSIDLVAKSDFGDVVIENQFGRSDHRHLDQLVTWVIRYPVALGHQDERDRTKMQELNQASAQVKRVFDPYLKQLDSTLDDEDEGT